MDTPGACNASPPPRSRSGTDRRFRCPPARVDRRGRRQLFLPPRGEGLSAADCPEPKHLAIAAGGKIFPELKPVDRVDPRPITVPSLPPTRERRPGRAADRTRRVFPPEGAAAGKVGQLGAGQLSQLQRKQIFPQLRRCRRSLGIYFIGFRVCAKHFVATAVCGAVDDGKSGERLHPRQERQ
jgi:hypothetical protein